MTDACGYTVIDAHQHCWRLDQATWPTPDLTAIYRDFLPGDFLQAAGAGVGSVLVQSQPNERDTDFLLALAAQHAHILGVVGWVDLAHGSAVKRLEDYAERPAFKGVRPMLQCLEDDQWILKKSLKPALNALVDLGLTFDALVYSRHLQAITTLAERYPTLRIVIDHGAKPCIAEAEWDSWYHKLECLAGAPNVYCKLSGLVTEAGEGASLAQTRAYGDALWQLFGPRRLMWGSDWPVLNLASNYGDWQAFAREMIESADLAAIDAIFCDNARAFYRL